MKKSILAVSLVAALTSLSLPAHADTWIKSSRLLCVTAPADRLDQLTNNFQLATRKMALAGFDLISAPTMAVVDKELKLCVVIACSGESCATR